MVVGVGVPMRQAGYPRLFDLVVTEARKKEANRKNKELKPKTSIEDCYILQLVQKHSKLNHIH